MPPVTPHALPLDFAQTFSNPEQVCPVPASASPQRRRLLSGANRSKMYCAACTQQPAQMIVVGLRDPTAPAHNMVADSVPGSCPPRDCGQSASGLPA